MTLYDHAESPTSPDHHRAQRHAVLATVEAANTEDALVHTVCVAAGASRGALFVDDRTGVLRSDGLPDVADGLPCEALAAFTAVVDEGPLRTATGWGRACAALGIASAVAIALRPTTGTRRVLVVGDPASPAHAAEMLEAIAPDAETALAISHRLREAAERSARADERTTLNADLIAIVSHELRTPLTSIIGALQTLHRPELAPPSDDARRLLDTALVRADRLRVLVDDLLVASRLDRRVLSVRMRPVDVTTVVNEVLDLVPGARAALAVITAADLPKPIVDPDHLARILRNLVENVLRHAPGAPAEIRLGSDRRHLTIDVVDRGPGVPETIRLFDRTAPPAGRAGGLGLGLVIARGLTEALHGTIHHEPTPAGGATFTLRLPLG